MIDKISKRISRLPVDRVEVFVDGELLTVEITDKLASKGVDDRLPCIQRIPFVPSYAINILAILLVFVFPRLFYAV